MDTLLFLLRWLFARALRLYPDEFRADFGEEMQHTFSDTIREAAARGAVPFTKTIAKEFFDFPAALWQAHRTRKPKWMLFQPKETMMSDENVLPFTEEPTAGEVIAGSLPFFIFGLILIFLELPHEWNVPGWIDTVGRYLFAFLLILPAMGFGIGWVRNFPRWSYPYAGMAFVLAMYIQHASTPGLRFFGYPIFGRELWGWRAWIPLGVAFVVALAISRSLKPFVKFFTNLWEDWSIPSYLMVGLLPLIVAISFDEMDRLYSLYFMVPLAVLLVGMVVFYLRGRHPWQRILALTVGILTILAATTLGTNSYWLEHGGTSLENARRSAATIALIMLLPAWLELFRRSVGRVRTA